MENIKVRPRAVRRFLMSVIVCSAVLFAACSGEQGAADEESAESDTRVRESPSLQLMVESGDIPPLRERLPIDPLIVQPVESIGTYGDTIRFISRVGASATTRRTISYENLVRWERDYSRWIPNVASNVTINEDSTVYQFQLREGLRWSDGELFTADDILFWYEKIILNDDIIVPVPDWMAIGEEVAEVAKIDDLTVEFRFPSPNGLFLQQMASVNGRGPTQTPAHYVRQFMPEFNEDANQLSAERGYDSPSDMVAAMYASSTLFDFVDKPSLDPWIYTSRLNDPTSRLVAERNPYYWKVDTAGNQLPYIDTFVTLQNDDRESLLLQTLNGDVDYVHSYINNSTNRPVLAENRDRGDYRFVRVNGTDANVMVLALNLTHQDPVLREVFQNRDFRVGLSYAIDRPEIIEIVLGGQATPHQVGPIPGDPLYNEQLSTQYTEFNVDLANEYLDRAGYQRNATGARVGPDGEPISFVLEVPDWDQLGLDIAQLVVGYWQRVGVEVSFNATARDLFFERKNSNVHDATVVLAPGGFGQDVLVAPRFYFPSETESDFAIAWAYWYLGREPQFAEEPPLPVQRQMELYDELLSSGDQDVQIEKMAEILQIAADEFFVIGTATPPPQYAVAKNNLRNILEPHTRSWAFPTPAPIDIFQWHFE